MEQEALRRAQEMHSHIPRTHSSENRSHSKEPHSEDTPASPAQDTPHKSEENHEPLFADKEKLLILSLILLLSAESKSDPSLTLALLYLIV